MAQEAVNPKENSHLVEYLSVKPQIFVTAPNANDAVKFYKEAFGAEEVKRDVNPKRKADQEHPLLLAAELKLGSFTFLVSDITDELYRGIKLDPSSCVICLETEDVEAAVLKAVGAGAVSVGEIIEGEGACCGGRVGKLTDPYGNVWIVCSPSAAKGADVEA